MQVTEHRIQQEGLSLKGPIGVFEWSHKQDGLVLPFRLGWRWTECFSLFWSVGGENLNYAAPRL